MKQPALLLILATLALTLPLPPLPAQDTEPPTGAEAPTVNSKPETVNSSASASAAASAAASASAAAGIIEGRIYSKLQDKTLLNARVRVKGSFKETFSDEYGSYRLVDLHPGEIELEVFYTGMAIASETVTLAPGARVTRDFELTPYGLAAAAAPKTAEDEVLYLEQYSVNARRETSMGAIAINEQRFSVVTKSVIDIEAYGEQTTDNVGDFLKFMPGVAVDYDGADPVSVSVRGFGGAFVPVTTDGMALANAASGLDTRAFMFDQTSMNNISRIEATKMPTPSDPANMIGGTINMITNSAFERRRSQLRYRFLYALNSENIEFMRKTPGPLYDYTYKALPGFDFGWTWPITKNFGIVAGARLSSATRERHTSQTQWNFLRNPMHADLWLDPYLQQYTMNSRPSIKETQALQLRADWRLARNHVFTLAYDFTRNDDTSARRGMTWDIKDVDVNSNNQAGIYANREWGWTPQYGYYVESAEAPARDDPNNPGSYIARSPNATIVQNVGGTRKNTLTNNLRLKYNYKGNMWNADAALAYSKSKSWQRDGDEGYFSSVKTKIKNYIARIGIYDIDPHGNRAPGSIIAYTVRTPDDLAMGFAYGQELDVFDINNYVIDKVELSTYDARDSMKVATLNIQRLLGNLPFYASIKMGGHFTEQARENKRGANRMTMLPDITNDNDPMMRYREASAFIDEGYSKVRPGFGLPAMAWVSPKKAYDTWLAHPDWFAPVKDQSRDTAREIYRGDTQITETITAFYFQLDARFLENRLAICTGVRWEMTDDRGLGCLELTEGDSAEDVYANWVRRGARAHRTYNDLYPSFHVNYDITANLKLRLSWATAMARPDFDSILPNIKISNSDTVYESEITINNSALKPYKAQSYDLSIEYYPPSGGSIGASIFYKRIANYFGRTQVVATLDVLNELNLSTDYLDYIITTKFNFDTMTTVYGGEFNFQFPLGFFGGWGRAFTVMANVTAMHLDAHYLADLGGLIKNMANFGVQYRAKRLSLGFTANYRGHQKKGAQIDADYYQRDPEGAYDIVPFAVFYEYQVPQLTFDASMEFKFSPRLSFIATARNITNRPIKYEVYNPTTEVNAPQSKPFRAELSGATITLGIKGTF